MWLKTGKNDDLHALARAWPHLHPWQRAILLAKAILYALPGYALSKRVHWIKGKAHWI